MQKMCGHLEFNFPIERYVDVIAPRPNVVHAIERNRLVKLEEKQKASSTGKRNLGPFWEYLWAADIAPNRWTLFLTLFDLENFR